MKRTVNPWHPALLLALLLSLGACVPLQSYHDSAALSLELNTPRCEVVNAAPCLEMRALEFSDRGNMLNIDQLDRLSDRIQAMHDQHGAAPNVVVYVHGWHHNAKASDSDLRQFKDRMQTMSTLSRLGDRPTIGVYVGWRGDSIAIPRVNVVTYYGRKRTAEIVGRTGLRQAVLRLESEVQRLEGRFVLIGHSFGTNAVLSAVQGSLVGRANEGSLCVEERKEMTDNGDLGDEEIQRRFAVCMRAARFGHGVYLFNPAIEANAFSPLRASMIGRRFARSQPKILHVVATKAETGARAAFSIAQRLLNTIWAVDRSDIALGSPCADDTCHDEVDLMTTTMGQYAPYWTGSMSNSQPGRADAIWRFQHIKGTCRSVLLPAGAKVIGGGLAESSLDPAHPDYDSQYRRCRIGSGAIPDTWAPFVITKHIPAAISDPIEVTIADWQLEDPVAPRDMFMKDHNAQLCTAPFAYITAAVLDNDNRIQRLRDWESSAQAGDESIATLPTDAVCTGSPGFSECFRQLRATYLAAPSPLDEARCN